MAGNDTTEEPVGPQRGLTYADYFGAIGNDVRRVAAAVWRERVVFLTIVFLSLVVGGSVALFSQPIYRAEALLTVRTASGPNDGFGRLLSANLGAASSIVGGLNNDKVGQELMAALEARSLIYPFIDKFNVKRAFFPKLWDEENGRWKAVYPGIAFRINNAIAGAPLPKIHYGPTLADADDELMNHMDISEDVKSGIIHLSIDWKDPDQAAVWVNGLVLMLNEKRRQEAIVDSQARIKSLQAQLATTTSVDMKQVDINLIQSETEQIVAAQSERQYALRVLDPAVSPEEHIWPKRGLIILLSLALGAVVGSIAALSWSVLFRGLSFRPWLLRPRFRPERG